jgi:hypothetical protein
MVKVADSNGDTILCDVTATSANVVTLAISGASISGTYRVIVSSL